MAHNTLIGGTVYNVTGGTTLVGGTSYNIAGGKTLQGGTAYDIKFGSPAPQMYYMYSYNPGYTYKYMYITLIGDPSRPSLQSQWGINYASDQSGKTPVPSNAIQVFIDGDYLCCYWNGNQYYLDYYTGCIMGILNPGTLKVQLNSDNTLTFLNTSVSTPNYLTAVNSYGETYVKIGKPSSLSPNSRTYLLPIQ